MELVTLAHITLSRVGSASRPGIVQHNELVRFIEAADETIGTLRELVIRIAEEHGEASGSLQMIRQEPAWNYTPEQKAVVFNIQGPNVQYSSPYAICVAFPALKVGGRYFKLEEIGKP